MEFIIRRKPEGWDLRDYWAGPVEKMKTLVRERKTEDVVLAPFEKEITVGRGKKKARIPPHSSRAAWMTVKGHQSPVLPSPSLA